MARAISSLPVPDSPVIRTAGRRSAPPASIWRSVFWIAALLADDAAVIGLDADFLLQIGVFQFQPLAQAIDFGERRAQLFVGLAALADVAEHDDGADDDAAVTDRGRGVFDEEPAAVLAPEHLAIDLMHGAVAERGVDRAIIVGIVPPVMMGVMHDRVHVLADQFFGRPAQHPLGRRIDEGGLAVGIDAVDAFAGGAQDQLVFALDIAGTPARPAAMSSMPPRMWSSAAAST